MDILVDFDNVEAASKRAGLVHFCTHLVDLLVRQKLQMPDRCRIRLYGGWYNDEKLTFSAQDLSTEIQRDFPNTIRWKYKMNSGACITQMEMACSLEADPQRHLFYTHRVREFTDHIKCDTKRLGNCTKPDCPLKAIPDFFKIKKCPTTLCYTTPGDLLTKQEQKLVDTMLTVDLIHLAKSGRTDLAVVSSDDDIWPGIQTALLSGASVIQIHTRNGRKTPNAYSTGLVNYRQTTL